MPTAPVVDSYYRDICIKGANLKPEEFDKKTGDPKVKTSSGKLVTYGEKVEGFVAGAKPLYNSEDPKQQKCMKLLNIPHFTTSASDAQGFSYYKNLDDVDFRTQESPYGTSNYYLPKAFFLGSQGCPESIFENTDLAGKPTGAGSAAKWKRRAEKCYDYYIFQRAAHPEWTLERTGKQTDDPLTGNNPTAAIFNSCQPLMSGKTAEKLKSGAGKPSGGFMAVKQVMDRPDLDDAEYKPQKYLSRSWNEAFPNKTSPAFPKYLPCVTTAKGGKLKSAWAWWLINPAMVAKYGAIATFECWISMGTYCKGPVHHVFPMTDPILHGNIRDDLKYTSKGEKKAGYCPNVEKINDPKNPFSPRDDYKHVDFDAPYSPTYRTDRGYSWETLQFVPRERVGNPWGIGYEKIPFPINMSIDELKKVVVSNPQDLLKLDETPVMCAIVPVDILEPRRKAFNNCIMQRIEFNYASWRWNNFLEKYHKKDYNWTPPCKTKYYEADRHDKGSPMPSPLPDPFSCPMRMTIQQCCQIIIKDVVPVNFLKLRTCEGLREKRMGKLGGFFDHIYDGDSIHGLNIRLLNQFGIMDSLMQSSGAWNMGLSNLDATMFIIKALDTLLNSAGGCDESKTAKELTFQHYFPPTGLNKASNMPYMRWWDTGASAGNPKRGGSPINTLGSYDAIVGVGREEILSQDTNILKFPTTPQGTSGNPPPKPMVLDDKPREAQLARIDGWLGMKAHQMWTTRRSNLVCLGRTEKLFKYGGGAEDFVLARAGANYVAQDGVSWPWPLGWRGFVNGHTNKNQNNISDFENNIPASSKDMGLHNAKAGDIVVFSIGHLNKIGYVTEGFGDSGHGRVTVENWDQGKFPTATGSSLSFGQPIERTIYQNGADMPEHDRKLADSDNAAKIGNAPSCADPYYTACVLPTGQWDSATVYHPRKDESRVCKYEFTYKKDKISVDDYMKTVSIDTSKIPSNILAKCVEDGYDPPIPLRLTSGFKGIGTAVKMDTTLCGPKWGSCKTENSATKANKCFPSGADCSVIKPPADTQPQNQ